MESLGKILMILGIVLVAAGALVTFAGKVPFIGKLPGDIYVSRKGFSFYFPITTSILISIFLSFIIWLVNKK